MLPLAPAHLSPVYGASRAAVVGPPLEGGCSKAPGAAVSNFLRPERATLARLLPGFDEALSRLSLAETERPGNPVLRDLTERVVVASKGRFDRAQSARRRSVLQLSQLRAVISAYIACSAER